MFRACKLRETAQGCVQPTSHFTCANENFCEPKITMKAKSNNLSVDATIFEQFNKLTSDDEKVRIKGASGLIKILEETSDEKVNKFKQCARMSLYYFISF